VLVLLLKAETHLVPIARARTGRPTVAEAASGPSAPTRRRLRLQEDGRLLPLFRPFQAVEATLLALVAAVADATSDGLTGSRTLLLVLAGAAVVAVCGHLVAVLRSGRLK
jgi:hypothetical protein